MLYCYISFFVFLVRGTYCPISWPIVVGPGANLERLFVVVKDHGLLGRGCTDPIRIMPWVGSLNIVAMPP